MPSELQYLWDYFVQLHKGRGSNGFGPNRISWQDLEAWSRRRRVSLDPWEEDAILAIDDAYLASATPPKKAPDNG